MQSLSRRAGKTRSRGQALQNGPRRARQNRPRLSVSVPNGPGRLQGSLLRLSESFQNQPGRVRCLRCRQRSRATDAESPPPLPPRKSEPGDSHEHAVKANGKFVTAKEKAQREGVHSLTSEDIEGLSEEQIKQLRGY